MRSPVVLFLLVGLVYASNNPGWKENNEYIYKVNGRTLARAFESSDQYSGILLKATLKIQPKSDGKLYGLISEPKYSQVHSKLPHGWNTFITKSELSWRPLALSTKPFLIEMENGVITDFVVSKDISEWEANILKGIASQFQLNTNGRNPSRHYSNILPKDGQNSATFVTMEDTVSGNTATLYEIRPLPKYVVQYREEESRYLDLAGDNEVIEVVKHKNYSDHVELPSYFYGFGDVATWQGSAGEPATNQMGRFVVRDTTSRAILTGSLKEYTVQSSVTTNKVFLSPNFYDEQMGSVISSMNVTLESMKPQTQNIPEISFPVKLGNLVYTYETLSKTNGVYKKLPYRKNNDWRMDSGESFMTATNMARPKRDIDEDNQGNHKSYKLEKPQMTEAPLSPLQPFSIGNKGKSIKDGINIVETVQNLAKQISNGLPNSDNIDFEKDLDRFVTLTSLIRIMNSNEVESATSALYSNAEHGPKLAAWTVYRDALSQSGTGPAFLSIKKCIETNKLRGEEASQVISTMAYAVREPTLQYMKAYFELIKTTQVNSEWPLNDTALLTFTDLIRRVYVAEDFSDKQYPEKSFGTFCSEEGEQFVTDEVIPYLTVQLNEAIVETQTQKVHAFIRALGNIGNPQILSAFEPYLEGRKQVSQFQRLLMILSMEKLVIHYPKSTLSLLFKVYQNPGESQEVRMAAVYQLMRCSPPAEVLQIMASYTNIDPQDQVNAAVVSSIRSAAELEGVEFHTLRYAAQAAKPLLTPKKFSIQSGANYLRSYLDEEMKFSYKQNTQFFGSEDALLPNGFRYTLRENLNGMTRKIVNAQAFVSSLEDFVQVVSENFEAYQQGEKEQKGQYQAQQQYPWSSLYINRILNMKSTEREQLEGNLLAKFGSLYRMFAFDNLTIAQFPEVFRQWEEKLNKGVNFNSYKMVNNREMTLSFPTELGLPFVFTRDTPTMMKVQGKLSTVSTPKVLQSGKIHKPDSVRVNSDMSITVTTKIQSRLSVITPFDSHRYTAGYDKHLQVYFPVNGNMEIDIKKMEITVELVPKKTQTKSNLFLYTTWPYTSKNKISNFEPLSSQPDTKVIKQGKDMIRYENTFGKRETGIAFNVEIERSRGFIDGVSLWRLFGQRNYLSVLLKLWNDNTIQYSKIGVAYVPTSIRKAVFRFGYRQEYSTKGEPDSHSKWNLEDYNTPSERQEKLMREVATEINAVMAHALDATADFHGDHTVYYILTGAFAKSNIDPKSRIMISYRNSSDNTAMTSYEAHFNSESNIPNTNGLDLDYIFQSEPTADTEMKIKFGPSQETLSKVDVHLKYSRSEERKQYLKELPMYKQCQQEMREGNKQMPACVNMTTSSNLLDRISMKVQYENLKAETEEAFRGLYEAIRFNFLPSLKTSRQHSSLSSNEIMTVAQFHPDLKYVNISVQTQDRESNISNIPVTDFAKQTFVSHPVFHLRSRYMSYFLAGHLYRPMCVADKTKMNTFSNTTYTAHISKYWTLMLQYIPKEARHESEQTVETQLKSQLENYAVLVRQSTESSKKDFKITVSSARTNFEVIDVELRPTNAQSSSEPKARITVQGSEVRISKNEHHEVKKNYIQIYMLPNGEVKVEVLDAFYIIYDGHRARLTLTSYKFKDSTRGLCGQFNGQSNEDFLTSENCFARDPKKFIKSFEVEGDEGKKVRTDFSRKTNQCVEKETPLYVNVVDNSNTMYTPAVSFAQRSDGCTTYQTRYLRQNGKICFTNHALPACSSHCKASGVVKKNVPVHCVEPSHDTELWTSQIDKGLSLDFTDKEKHESVLVEVPQHCSE